jgi:neutral ceramidase
MALVAGFAQTDITPPLGTHKIGWLEEIIAESIADPLFARAAVIQSESDRIAFVQLDTLSIRWTQVADIRNRIERQHSFPGAHIMIAATHNHAGPAVAGSGDVPRDDAYIESMVASIVAMFGDALANAQQAEIGLARVSEAKLSHNRRTVMRSGLVHTHGSFDDPDALFTEGPIDPEVAVLAARAPAGQLLGAIANFACHPTHHGGDTTISGGFPGVLAREMKARGCPVTLFLNGASGNISMSDPPHGGEQESMEAAGRALADDAERAVRAMSFRGDMRLGARSRTVQLPYRRITDDEIRGTARGAQRFIDSAIYDRGMPELVRRIRERGSQPAEVQVLSLDEHAFAAVPAEYFVELGLRIKQEAYPRRALVVSCANGMVGYVPHREAFLRGGYETTFAAHSKLAPEAGDILADTAVALINQDPPP